jgi:hypothetical protein
VSGLNVSISAEGFSLESETENGFDELVQLWKAGAAVECKRVQICREHAKNKYGILGK